MLTRSELTALEHALADDRVLSIYIDGTEPDAGAKSKWRLDLAHSLEDLRAWLAGSPADERRAFEESVARLDQELESVAGAVGAPGWVAFIGPRGLLRAERVPVPTPTLAVWSTGPSIAPYMRVLKQTRPVVVAVVDSRKARVYRYVLGELVRMETTHAHATVEARAHMGDTPRPGFHSGVRGPTGRDAAQQSLLAGTRRMTREVARDAVRLAGPDGWILIGGVPAAASRLRSALAQLAPGRIHLLESLDVHASDAAVEAAAREGASAMRDAADLTRIDEIIEHADGQGLGAIGPAATREALASRQVHELYVTHRYLVEHPAEAEDAVRAALAQGASVEEVSRAAAERLDAHGGMGARLRYRRTA
jgi:hypothetical protein